MSDLMGIASNAVAAYQMALSTTSNNIANVATEGYTREQAVLGASPLTKAGQIYLGTGVVVERITRQYNAFVDSNLRNSNSDLASQEPMVTYTNRVVDVMGGPTMGLNTALDQFFTSARALSSDPASTVLRGSFVRDAQSVADRFGQLNAQLDDLQAETGQAIQGDVDAVNSLSTQLAQINGQLTKHQLVRDQPSGLLDQRDYLLQQLSQYAHVNTRFTENGSVVVSLGPSVNQDIIVNGNKAIPIGVDSNAASPDKAALFLDPYGNRSSLSGITSGQIAGLMSFREQVLGTTRSALDNLARNFVAAVNQVHTQGINGYGKVAGNLFTLAAPPAGAASGMKVAFDDPMLVSASAQFRVIEASGNTSRADATIRFTNGLPANGAPLLPSVLPNNAHPSAGVAVSISSSVPLQSLATVPNGLSNVSFFMDGAQSGQQINIFTRDGRQVLGGTMSSALKTQVVTSQNGFVPGATFSDAYLNKSGMTSPGVPNGYKGMTVFYGAQAAVLQQPLYNNKDEVVSFQAFAPRLQSSRISGQTTAIDANAFKLNGVSLGALAAPATGTTRQASALATWINAQTSLTGVTASAVNEIRVDANQFKAFMPLSLNGTAIDTSAASTLQGLANAINLQSNTTQLSASVDANGVMVLTNASTAPAGNDIKIDTTSYGGTTINALGISAGTFSGTLRLDQPLKTGAMAGTDTPLQLTFGSSGTPADLAKLGFRTEASISGTAPDDLIVFVTGAGTTQVSASYQGKPVNPRDALRSQPMRVDFVSPTSYRITDVTTGTLVAERTFDPAQLDPGLNFQGLELAFSSPPTTGDSFLMDGNSDGIGNNENALLLAALENKALIGSKTLSGAYIDHVNEMGNVSRQATIAKTALTVVHEQAAKARDELAGVSLDAEAADLIRFQQAYQASAKVMQTSSQLFDSILQIR